jgi:prolyl oligopeptidase
MNPESKSQLVKLSAPPKAKISPVVDVYHGHQIRDPYRWLEDAESTETRQFVAAENDYTQSILEQIPGRDQLRSRIERLLTIGRMSAPRVAGKRYFYERRDGRQNQAVVYVREGRSGEDRVLIDVNTLSPDGTVSLDWWYPSDDGQYVAFGTSANGSELSTLQVINAGSGTLLAEKIERTRAASVAWLPDNSGFYYTRYPRPGDVPQDEEVYNRRVFFHPLNQSENAGGTQDALVFPDENHTIDPQHWPDVFISNDGRWLLVEVSQGWTKTDLYLKDLSFPSAKFQRITEGKDFLYYGKILDGQLYITTNEDAPRLRVLKASCATPERANWQEIIPESGAVIEGRATVIGKKLFVHYFRNASSQLQLFDLEGKLFMDVPMPALGSIFDLGGKWNSDSGFFGFISYAVPPTVYEIKFDGQNRMGASGSPRH